MDETLNGCPGGYEPIFHRMWNGTYYSEDCEADLVGASCNKKGIEPRNMTKIYDKTVCGLRGGKSFIE